ncbi:MAG TPA: DUF4390 domain-containing protein [bacterium]
MRTIVTNAIFAVLLWTSGNAHPFAGDAIRVERITPRLVNNSLTVSANFVNLFSAKIVGTIQSGLPSIIQIEVRLKENDARQVAQRQLVRSISFNVWDNRYTIRDDSTRFLSDLEEVKNVSSRLEGVVIVTAAELRTSASYQLQVRVAIVPISSSQGKKVTDWLLDPNQTEETLASDDRAGGFKLNLSNLLSFFVGDKKQSQYSSDWHGSPTFRIDDLK